MQTYSFTSKKRELGKMVFALTLNRKRMTERIVIGRTEDVRRLLSGGDSNAHNHSLIYYDTVRPLGSLLLNFEADPDGNWNKNGIILRESYSKIFPPHSAMRSMAKPASEFLTLKYNSGEPSAMFAAIRTWEDYLNCFSMNHSADMLTSRLSMLYKPFRVYSKSKPWQNEAAAALSVALHDSESNVELWHIEELPGRSGREKNAGDSAESREVIAEEEIVGVSITGTKGSIVGIEASTTGITANIAGAEISTATKTVSRRKTTFSPRQRFEVVVASSSFLPIIFYYMNKIDEWRFVFQECKVCNNYFLARSRHYELCSDNCRKVKSVQAKREYDKRAKESKLEQLDEAAYYFWYNRLRKLRKGKAANPEAATVFKTAFDTFRKEAVKRKSAVKRREIPLADFSSWLVEQQNEADRLMEELVQ